MIKKHSAALLKKAIKRRSSNYRRMNLWGENLYKGDTLATNYIADQFKKLGLKPGNGNSYFQEVPMVEITSTPNVSLSLKSSQDELTLQNLSDYVVTSRRLQEQVELKNTELVFVGFGIVAPEYQWNDYQDLDVREKLSLSWSTILDIMISLFLKVIR